MRETVSPFPEYVFTAWCLAWCLVKHMVNFYLREDTVGRCGLDASGSGQGPVVGFCASGCIKGVEFHEQLSDYLLLQKDSAP
jgi:hypothetical protein